MLLRQEKSRYQSGISEFLSRNFSDLHSPHSIDQYTKWGKGLGPTIKPHILKELMPYNMAALDTTAIQYQEKWSGVQKGLWAIIIPAHNELGVGNLLKDITFQLHEIYAHNDLGLQNVQIIIAINGEGNDIVKSKTAQAIQQFIDLHDGKENRIHIIPKLIPQQGKLVAYNAILDELEEEGSQPELLMFFDADFRLKNGCLRALHTGLTHHTASSVGIEVNEKGLGEFAKAISKFTIQQAREDYNHGILQGGAFAIRSDLTPLYHAYLSLFPGTYGNDFNWNNVLRTKKIPISVSQNKLSVLSPANNIWKLFQQQDRWLKGFRQAGAFIETNKKNMGISIPNEIKKMFAPYFPEFPRLNMMQIEKFMIGFLRNEMPITIFYAFLFFAIETLPSAIPIGHNVHIGGPPPNIFIPGSWPSPRDD